MNSARWDSGDGGGSNILGPVILFVVVAFAILFGASVVLQGGAEAIDVGQPNESVQVYPDTESLAPPVLIESPSFIPDSYWAVAIDASSVRGAPMDTSGFPECGPETELEFCSWTLAEGGRFMTVELSEGGNHVGTVELLEVETAEFSELSMLAEQGYETAWMARIHVLYRYSGSGLGRLLWRAGDHALRTKIGADTIRLFADTAGWGSAIMAEVPYYQVIVEGPPYWIYFVGGG